MKCQRNASPYSACLRSSSCARFSPTTSTPASTSTAMSASETYFVAATIVTRSPTSSRMRSYAARTASGDVADHPLSPGDAGVTAVREVLAVAGGAHVCTLDRRHARVVQDPLGDGPEVEVASAHGLGAEAVAVGRRDVVAHFVTARPDPRSDGGGKCTVAECGDPPLDDPCEEPEPARVQERERRPAVVASECDRETVRRQLQHRDARLVGPEPVAFTAALAWDSPVHRRRVNLAVHRQPTGIGIHCLAEAVTVLLDVVVAIVRQQAEVQGVVRALADSAAARGERDAVRPRRVPPQQRHAHATSASARASSSSLVFSEGSSTTASSNAASARPSLGPSE